MANVRVETNRHIWIPRLLFRPDLDDHCNERGMVMALHCENCRKPWHEPTQGSPPVGGCLAGVRVKQVGRARAGDYQAQEARLLAEQEARG